jgi:FtsP/CotA-like multicopper oxidase with cupredoxin domain
MRTHPLPAILAISIVLALAACGGADTATGEPAAPPPPPPPAVTETESQTTSETTTEAEPPPATETEPAQTETEPAETQTEPAETETVEAEDDKPVVIRVEGGEPKGGAKTITVKQGEQVRIRVVVDEPQEIHIHGYELEREATPDDPAEFEFTAELEGIFDIETHLTDAKIGTLVVEP